MKRIDSTQLGMIKNQFNAWKSSDNRKFIITVMGMNRPEITAKNTETMLVPFERLSQTIKQIHRQGGKIVEIRDTQSGVIRLIPTESSSLKTATSQKRRPSHHSKRHSCRYSSRKRYKIYTLG